MAVASLSDSSQVRASKPALRVFISSPGDVAEERVVVGQVLRRLQSEFEGRGAVEAVDWEHEPLLATASFQEQLPLPSQCDIVVAILWTRLGTRLPARIHRPDGSCYASGTEFEFEDAAAAFQRTARPDLLVYRKTADPQVSLGDEQALLERLGQKRALDEFVERWFVGKDGVTLEAAFHPFAHAAELEALAETHLRKLLDRLLPAPAWAAEVAQPIQWRAGSPFRGLEVFELEHAAIFFGRRWEIVEVLGALRQQAAAGRAFVLILGMTGCGKSSLVRAGVLPMLLQPGVIEGIGLWRRAILRPSDARGDLFAGLAAALLREEALPELAAAGTQAGELAQALRQAPRAAVALLKTGLSEAAARAAAERGLAEPPKARLVLVVDQLEELFTLEQATAEDRSAYVAAIDALARSGVAWVIATLRSDFYPRISELAGLAALKEGAGQYDLLAATSAEIGQMIRRPTSAAGLRFEVDLVTDERLDDVLRDEAARNPASLPLLEFALEELYKERNQEGVLTFAAYRRLGGIDGALARRAEQVFESLPERVQASLPVVLRALVTLAPAGEFTASKSPQQGALSSSPEVAALVDAFVRARLFVAKLADDGSATVELAHEALLGHWPRLSRWLEEDRESMRVSARVAEQAALWNQNGRSADYLLAAGKPSSEAAELLARRGAELGDAERQLIEASLARERRRRRRRHRGMASLLALALIAVTSALVAAVASHKAEIRRLKALELIDYILGDLHEKLDPIARLDILDSTSDRVHRYFSVAGEAARADWLLEARAWDITAEVRFSQGRPREAAAAARQSLALAEPLARRDPGDDEARLEVGRGHNHLGMADQAAGDFAAALRQYRTSEAILDGLVTKHPARSDWLGEAVKPHSNLVNVLLHEQDPAGALPESQRALEILRMLVAGERGSETLVSALANTLNGLANIRDGLGDFAGARQALLESTALTRRLVAADPADNFAPQLLARAQEHSGRLAEMQGRADEAREQYRFALGILAKVASRDSSDTTVAERLAECHLDLGRVLALNGDPRPALEQTRAGTDIMRALLRQDPRRASWKYLAAWLQQVSGRALLLGGDAGGAVRELRRAVAALEPLGKDYQVQLATTLAVLGDALAAAGQPAAARTAWSRAVALLVPSAGTSYDPLALDAWARSLLQLGRGEEARPALARLAAIGYKPAHPFPGPGVDKLRS